MIRKYTVFIVALMTVTQVGALGRSHGQIRLDTHKNEVGIEQGDACHYDSATKTVTCTSGKEFKHVVAEHRGARKQATGKFIGKYVGGQAGKAGSGENIYTAE